MLSFSRIATKTTSILVDLLRVCGEVGVTRRLHLSYRYSNIRWLFEFVMKRLAIVTLVGVEKFDFLALAAQLPRPSKGKSGELRSEQQQIKQGSMRVAMRRLCTINASIEHLLLQPNNKLRHISLV
jgi:hypothetical protein